jgi:hypothetical protein
MMSNVPILRMLCSRHYTAITIEIQPLPTSETDSAQNFGLGVMGGRCYCLFMADNAPCELRFFEIASFCNPSTPMQPI